ncbi:protease, insulinase family/protease, insulinase family [hydrothermal vent metagenome]|uniref:Protease, insulinase family/protease, insulinase family n=1 Tax=hydrothermal vent metagenome TaxID=652676 RepID=A0A1W1CM45_9ZZZZ
MYKLIFFLLLLLLNFSYVNAQELTLYKSIKYLQLENGLKLYMLNDKKAVNTQIDLEVGVGMSVETDENAGITHLLEHLLFRDARIPYSDYLDYLKEEGATYVNGYTQDFTTGYVATIDANKSYFLVEAFAQMIFDKNVSKKDLEIEKKALQNEIGELQWYHYFSDKIVRVFLFIADAFPNEENIWQDSFMLEKAKKRASSYQYKTNNIAFSLEEVLEHYKHYYYPKNMTLKIAGNFDPVKMEALVREHYGKIQRIGTQRAKEKPYNAQLIEKAYKNFQVGTSDTNTANLGTRYILDDYKKYLILVTYNEYLSSKMQKLLRNSLGQTYSVSSYIADSRNAGLAGVTFVALHDDFDENLRLIQDQVLQDVKHMSEKDISEALAQSELYYTSKEHDSETLMDLLGTQVFLKKQHMTFLKR